MQADTETGRVLCRSMEMCPKSSRGRARASIAASDQVGRWDFSTWVQAVKPFCEATHVTQVAAPGDIARRLELFPPFQEQLCGE